MERGPHGGNSSTQVAAFAEGTPMLGDELRRPTSLVVARWPHVRRGIAYLIACSLLLLTLKHLPHLWPQLTVIALAIWAIAAWQQRPDL